MQNQLNHIECVMYNWPLSCRKDKEKLEQVQSRAARMIKELEGIVYEDRLKGIKDLHPGKIEALGGCDYGM